jgi:hypothetical protein
MFYTPEQKNLTPQQIDEICEQLWKLEKPKSCHDCGAKPGERHEEGCDVARCTSCGSQRLVCSCEDGEPEIWTGLWLGVKECYEQKLICFDEGFNSNWHWCFDLNKWYENSLKTNKK